MEGRPRQPEWRQADAILLERLLEVCDRCSGRPVLDPRSDEEIVGYDERGLPT